MGHFCQPDNGNRSRVSVERSKVVSSLVVLSDYHDLEDETLHLAVYYMDRLLASKPFRSDSELHVIGAASIWLAAKYEEQVSRSYDAPGCDEVTPLMWVLTHLGSKGFRDDKGKPTGKGQVTTMLKEFETAIIRTLGWEMSTATSANWLHTWRHQAPEEFTEDLTELASQLCELSLYSWQLVTTSPSMIAASAISLARSELQCEPWPPALAQLTGIALSRPADMHSLNYTVGLLLERQKYARRGLLRLIPSGPPQAHPWIEHMGVETLFKFEKHVRFTVGFHLDPMPGKRAFERKIVSFKDKREVTAEKLEITTGRLVERAAQCRLQ
jgi:hypothetical protein